MSELTYEKIANAIKATDYKYFGDYELSDKQLEAVETLVDAAVELMSFSERSASAPQSEWISVDDSLPDAIKDIRFSLYLTIHKDWDCHCRILMFDNFERVFTRDGDDTQKITHWMPLPPPPETKK